MTIQFDPEITELQLAYKRAKSDRPSRCFVEYPYLIKWAELNLSVWLKELQEKCTVGFQPHSSRLCWLPKPNSLLRPGNIIHFKDEVVYNLLLARLYKSIWNVLQSFQGEPDAAYVLAGPDKTEWFQNNFTSWDGFRNKSIEYIEDGAKFVVVADITGFYENIDIDKLLSDLRHMTGGAGPEIELLRNCLRKWSARGEKGIPQGYSASDLLAKVYAYPVDIALRNEGYRHLRYVDDIRIFCSSRIDAKRAILSLSQHIHKRGLNLQSAKTRILSTPEAFAKFDGVKPIVEGIQQDLLNEIQSEIKEESPYPDSEHIEFLLRIRKELPSEVLERTFEEYFAASNPAPFDKTLFHYLLNRLGKAKSRIAVNYCLDALRERTEETQYILKYFSEIGPSEKEISPIVDYMVSPVAIYDYQCYQLLKWLYTENINNDLTLKYCRRIAGDFNRDLWLRSWAIAYLGNHGDIADLQSIESMYASCSSDFEKADCVMALSRMEHGRRNAFYSAIKGDGLLVDRAVQMVKDNKRIK
jgi:hypothetical protein